MKPFRELTRRSRLYRLRVLAKEALKAYEIEDAHLSFIQYGENVTYRVDLPVKAVHSRGASPYTPDRFLLRVHAMGDTEAIASELTWLEALSQEAGLSVPAPIPTLDGKLMATIVTPGMPQGGRINHALVGWAENPKWVPTQSLNCIREGCCSAPFVFGRLETTCQFLSSRLGLGGAARWKHV